MGFISDVSMWTAVCVNEPKRIAEALQRIGRFGGQHPTSNVLRHSLEVAWMCRTLTTDAQLWALFHDAHEVLSGDVTRAFKTINLELRQNDADKALKRALEVTVSEHELALIHHADTLCGDYEFEQWDLYRWQFSSCEWWHRYQPNDNADLFALHATELQRLQKKEKASA